MQTQNLMATQFDCTEEDPASPSAMAPLFSFMTMQSKQSPEEDDPSDWIESTADLSEIHVAGKIMPFFGSA